MKVTQKPIAGTADIPAQLQELAKEIVSGLSQVEAEQRKELLSGFVSELYLLTADQLRSEERRKRQKECVAAAKARGVRFGRTAPPLPENFEECRQAWRKGEISQRQAAKNCGMPASSFRCYVQRMERDEEH